MAKHMLWSLRVELPLLSMMVASLLLTGCTGGGRAPAVALPPPSFAGPVIGAPSPVARPAYTAPRALASSRMTGPRDWIPTAPPRPWKWIVIHHSATPSGNAAEFDKMHRAKGWDELGYHFVIGNGTGSRDGQVEIGPRWPKQKWGAHAKTPDNRYNDYGIGICLVGNFDIERPTAAQMQSLARLVAFLEKTYHIPSDRVIGHGDTKPTDCPGKFMNVAQVRRMAMQALAEAGESTSDLAAGAAAPAPALAASASTDLAPGVADR